MSKHYRWTYSINNPTEDDVRKMLTVFARKSTLEYDAQDEVGDTGTPHIQGHIVFKCQRTMTALAKDFPRAHLEVMYKSVLANRRYCTKERTRAPNGRRWSSNSSDLYVPEKEKVLLALGRMRLERLKKIMDDQRLDLICNGLLDDKYI